MNWNRALLGCSLEISHFLQVKYKSTRGCPAPLTQQTASGILTPEAADLYECGLTVSKLSKRKRKSVVSNGLSHLLTASPSSLVWTSYVNTVLLAVLPQPVLPSCWELLGAL